MNENTITVMGNVVNDPELHVTRAGQTFVTFRLASTARRQNQQTKAWESVSTNFYSVSAWRALAGNVAESIRKGEPVIVHGRLRVNDFIRKDQSKGTRIEIDALTIGHDLSLGSAQWRRGAVPVNTGTERSDDQSVQRAFDNAEPDYERVDSVTGEVFGGTELHSVADSGDEGPVDPAGTGELHGTEPDADQDAAQEYALAQ